MARKQKVSRKKKEDAEEAAEAGGRSDSGDEAGSVEESIPASIAANLSAGLSFLPQGELDPRIADQRDYVVCGSEMNYHTASANSANMYMTCGVSNHWDLDAFKAGLQVKVNKLTPEAMEFDLVGVDPAIANALRRIMISEVPTVAIEHVFFINNTSIVQDEVLAHRLGLVPLKADAQLLETKTVEEGPNEKNTIIFKLDVKCHTDADGEEVHRRVLSSALEWMPAGSEIPTETSCRFAIDQSELLDAGQVAAVHSDIVLAKMTPGQAIQVECHAVRGTGKEHAKWSPVATAWYRMQPEVIITKDITGDMAERLATECPGLFTVKGGKAVAHSAREHEMVLEKARRLSGEPEEIGGYEGYFQVRKCKQHFIFTIETVGGLPPEVILERALDILSEKCAVLQSRV